MKWLVAALVLLGVVVAGAHTLKARRQSSALAASQAASAPPPLELGAADLLVSRTLPLTRTLGVSGGLKAVTSAVVKAKVASELKSLTVREGDAVKAGQVIGRLDTTEFDWRIKQAEQTALSARTQLDIARRALDNNRALVAQGFISATALETAISTEAGAAASHQAALAATELARKSRADAVLVAPISGIVSQRLAQPGERVAVDAKVIEIVDLSHIELEAAVAPEDVGGVQVGQVARLSVDGLSEPAIAKVVRINPSTQTGTRAVMIYLAVQPQAGLRQGLFARGTVELQRRDAIAVPVSAVRVDQARPFVLVIDGAKVAQRTVALGMRGEAVFDTVPEAAVEITSGVTDGTTLLRAAAGAVRDGTPVKVAAATSAASAAAAR
jgi:RND family efflux transporter MFP subunit